MPLEPQSLILMRALAVLLAAFIVLSAFFKFRGRRISRLDTAFRWVFGLGVIAVAVYPNSVNFVVQMLAMDRAAYGRMLVLLVLSSLGLWVLLFRERTKVYELQRNLDRFVRGFALSQGTGRHSSKLAHARILVALPALNEARNLGQVLDRMPEAISSKAVGVVVIDDGSTDETAEVAEQHGAAVVSNPMRRGQGAALRLAYDVAQHIGAEIVVTLDSDGQHRPEEIVTVVEPILKDEKDFVIGSRLLGERERDSWFRLLGIYVNNALINILAGTRVSDCSSGFKAIRVSALERIDLTEDQFQAAEAIIAAAHSGLRIGEAPITVKRRLSGESKKGRNLSYGLNFARSVFKSWWR